jgi:hypothetical protein
MLFCKRGNLYLTGYRAGAGCSARGGNGRGEPPGRPRRRYQSQRRPKKKLRGGVLAPLPRTGSWLAPGKDRVILYGGEGKGRKARGNRSGETDNGSVYSGGGKTGRHGLTTDEKGRKIPAPLSRKADTADCEACRYGNRLERTLRKEAGRTATALNAGDLRIIRKSRKRAGREGAR